MRFGVTFFPDVTPDVKSAHQYYAETFELVDFAADLGFMHAKIIEHYLSPYGGYSPDPLQFLAAVAARQPDMRLMTGAVIPAFGHPLQLAARIALLDSMSGGRLDVGLARAFLPHEFDAFGVSMDDSRPLYEESIEAVRRLLTEEEVTFEGRYHRFEKARSLPRPVQQPHPPILCGGLSHARFLRVRRQTGHEPDDHAVLPASGGARRDGEPIPELPRGLWP